MVSGEGIDTSETLELCNDVVYGETKWSSDGGDQWITSGRTTPVCRGLLCVGGEGRARSDAIKRHQEAVARNQHVPSFRSPAVVRKLA